MKILHLVNDTYQVWDDAESTCLFQGSKAECVDYTMERAMESLRTEDMLAILRRLAVR